MSYEKDVLAMRARSKARHAANRKNCGRKQKMPYIPQSVQASIIDTAVNDLYTREIINLNYLWYNRPYGKFILTKLVRLYARNKPDLMPMVLKSVTNQDCRNFIFYEGRHIK